MTLEAAEIKKEFQELYLAEDGGVRLDPLPEDDEAPFPGFNMRRVHNDNGLLYHAEWIAALFEANQLETDDKARFLTAVNNHRAPGMPGEYLRHPGNTITKEAHDNYVGIAGASMLCNAPSVAKEICQRLEMQGWVVAGEPLQGGDVAFIKLCAGWHPALYEQLWLALGMLVTILWGHGPSKVLGNFRATCLRQLSWDISALIGWAVFAGFGDLLYGDRNNIPKIYFRADHPILRMLEQRK